jgi:hypothetical protein
MVVRPGHPLTKGRITKQRLFEFPHVVVEMTGAEEHEQGGFFGSSRSFPTRLDRAGCVLEYQDKHVNPVGWAAVLCAVFCCRCSHVGDDRHGCRVNSLLG